MSQNFCVIDIGTNAVKCKMFTEEGYYTPFNKFLSNKESDDLDADEVVKYISEFMAEAQTKKIDKKNIYIAAKEGFRTSLNQEEIQQKVKFKD